MMPRRPNFFALFSVSVYVLYKILMLVNYFHFVISILVRYDIEACRFFNYTNSFSMYSLRIIVTKMFLFFRMLHILWALYAITIYATNFCFFLPCHTRSSLWLKVLKIKFSSLEHGFLLHVPLFRSYHCNLCAQFL